MATNNSVDSPLAGTTGTGNFVGSNTPSITTPKIITSILDSNGNTMLAVSPTASAVNYISIANNSTGAAPLISATGSDSNVNLQLTGKGTGGVTLEGTGTNDSPPAGYVGEVISNVIASGSALSMANGTAKDITSISLTKGDWDIWGNIYYGFGAISANLLGASAWINTTSATQPDVSVVANIEGTLTFSSVGLVVVQQPIKLTSTTIFYLSGIANFSTGSVTGCGGLYARRRR